METTIEQINNININKRKYDDTDWYWEREDSSRDVYKNMVRRHVVTNEIDPMPQYRYELQMAIKSGGAQKVKYLVEQYGIDPTFNNLVLLRLAIDFRHDMIVKYLMKFSTLGQVKTNRRLHVWNIEQSEHDYIKQMWEGMIYEKIVIAREKKWASSLPLPPEIIRGHILPCWPTPL